MSVHQTKDGRWFVRYKPGTIKKDPARTREYFGRGEEARQFAENRNRDLGFGERVEITGKTFTDCAALYLKHKANNIERRSVETAHMHIVTHLAPFFGNTPVTNLRHEDVDEYVAARRTVKWKHGGCNGMEKTGVSRSTIKRELSTLQAVLNFSAKRGEILHNPVLYYQMPREDDAVIAVPTMSEINAILRVSAPHLKRFITIGYYTAARPGREILDLKWSNVDFIGRTIFVISARKHGLVSRRIDLHPELEKQLTAWYVEDKSTFGTPEYIVHYNHKRIGKVDKAWKIAKQKANILRRLRLYDIRHASITAMLEAGSDLKAVSMAAGHANPAMTMRKYQHVSSALKKDAINSLGTIGKSPSKAKIIRLRSSG